MRELQKKPIAFKKMSENVLACGVLVFGWLFVLSMFLASRMSVQRTEDLSRLEHAMHEVTYTYPRPLAYVRFPGIEIPRTLSTLKEYPKLMQWMKHLCYYACLRHIENPRIGIATHIAHSYHEHMIFPEHELVFVMLHELCVILEMMLQSNHEKSPAYVFTMLDNLWVQILKS